MKRRASRRTRLVAPPSRGRGLKRHLRSRRRRPRRSPPSRGRGLKQERGHGANADGWSPPSRGRGLKRRWHLPLHCRHGRPPRGRGLKLRPRGPRPQRVPSPPPSRGRGLKRRPRHQPVHARAVPFTGARVEAKTICESRGEYGLHLLPRALRSNQRDSVDLTGGQAIKAAAKATRRSGAAALGTF